MTFINFFNLNNPETLLGTDIKIDTGAMFDNPIGRITNIDLPDTHLTPTDDGYPHEDVTITVEDHFQDRTWKFDPMNLPSAAVTGDTYETHYIETRQEDGNWERGTENYLMETAARDAMLHSNTNNQQRVMTETYTVGTDRTNRSELYLTEDGLHSPLLGRNTLAEVLAAFSIDDAGTVFPDGEEELPFKITAISPEELDHDPDSASAADGALVPDNYTITATDPLAGTLTITYDAHTDTATVHRAPSASSDPDIHPYYEGVSEPGEFTTEVHGLSSRSNPVEYFYIPWFETLETRVNTSTELCNELNIGSHGVPIGCVYTTPRKPHELHHAKIDRAFRREHSEPINDLITVDTFNTYGVSS